MTALHDFALAGEVVGAVLYGGMLPVHLAEKGVFKEPAVLEKMLLLPLQIKRGEVFVYKVGNLHHVINGVWGVELKLLSGQTFEIWEA